MIRWLTQRRMVGGLVFGPPAWSPDRIENTFDRGAAAPHASPTDAHAPPPPHHVKLELPAERREAAAFLEDIGIGRLSAIIPALADQLRNLRDESGRAGDASGGGTTAHHHPHPGWRVRALVLNCLPTQPEFALPEALTRLALDDLLAGLMEIQRLVKAQRVIVVIDSHASHQSRAWKQATEGTAALAPHGALIEIKRLLNRYPQAHPTILMRSLFGKRLAPDMLASRLHRVLVDPVTCWAIGRWIRTGHAMTERPVQLFAQPEALRSGQSRASADAHEGGPHLVMARLGETVAQLCARYGVSAEGLQIICNGMLTGREIDPQTTLVDGQTESVAIRVPIPPEAPSACLACGWCVDVCPTRLTPVHLFDLARRAAADVDINGHASREAATIIKSSDAHESLHCIGCGLCSFVCPTRLPLTRETLALRLRIVQGAGQTAARPAGARTLRGGPSS